MADRGRAYCEYREHSSCSACGAPTFRRALHSHNFSPRGSGESILCGDCWALSAAAAAIILEALEGVGVRPSARQLMAMRDEGKIGILVQGLPLPEVALN